MEKTGFRVCNREMKSLLLITSFVLLLAASHTSHAAPDNTQKSELAKPAISEDRVLTMMRAVFLDALNHRAYSGPNSYAKPFQMKDGYYFYEKYRLTEEPQKEESEFRIFLIDKLKIKFKGDEFVSEEVRFGYKLKYAKKTGEIQRWRETNGWMDITHDPFFGKNPKLKNFKLKAE